MQKLSHNLHTKAWVRSSIYGRRQTPKQEDLLPDPQYSQIETTVR